MFYCEKNWTDSNHDSHYILSQLWYMDNSRKRIFEGGGGGLISIHKSASAHKNRRVL